MLVNDEHIVLITQDKIFVWGVPDLYPRNATTFKPTNEVTPAFVIPLENPLGPSPEGPALGRLFCCEKFPDWYNCTHGLTAFDVISKNIGDLRYKQSDYSVKLPVGGSGGATQLLYATPLHYFHGLVIDPRPCNGMRVKIWKQGFDLHMSVTPAASEEDQASLLSKIRYRKLQVLGDADREMHLGSMMRRDEFTFDPISGCLYIIIGDDDAGESMVRVYELPMEVERRKL